MQMRVTYLPVNYKTVTDSSLVSETLFDPKAQLKSHDVDIPLYDQHLNEMGAEDWELISVQPLPNVEYTKKRDITVTGGFYFFWQRKPRPRIEETATESLESLESLKNKDSFPDLSFPDVPSANVFSETKETIFPRSPVNASTSSSTANTTIAQDEVPTESIKQEVFSSVIANSRIQNMNTQENNGTQDNITKNGAGGSTKDMSAWDNYGMQDHVAKNDVNDSTKGVSVWDNYDTPDQVTKVSDLAKDMSPSTVSDKEGWSTSLDQDNTLAENEMNDSSSSIEYEESFNRVLKQESFTEKLMANNELKNKIDSIKGLLRGNVDTAPDITANADSETKTNMSAENDFPDFDADILTEEDISPSEVSRHLEEKNRKSFEGDPS